MEGPWFMVRGQGAPGDLARAGTAFFDNFLVREGMCDVVPEPASLVLVAMGLALTPFVARRQRRAGFSRG